MRKLPYFVKRFLIARSYLTITYIFWLHPKVDSYRWSAEIKIEKCYEDLQAPSNQANPQPSSHPAQP